MTNNDLTAPLGQNPTTARRVIKFPAAQIIAVALGLFFGLFMLWAVVAQDPSGGEPVAVAPADLHFAKKEPTVVAVPQPAAPAGSAQPAAPAQSAAAPVKPPDTVTITIVDGKTGAKREVVLAAPPPANPPAVAPLVQDGAATSSPAPAPKGLSEPNRPGASGSLRPAQ
jgi:uncharacterized protein